jgi:DNA-binding LytR/AlgR family response regulator
MPITTIIIEDEALAAERLADLILQYDAEIEILAQLDTVEDAVEWFENNDAPNLAFFDIQLADGLSFEIFEQTKVDCPVIFTTAYDAYALKAFKVNSIDYLLKPINPDDLQQAMHQYEELFKKRDSAIQLPDLGVLQQAMQMITQKYKSRFMVKAGSKLSAIPTSDVDYFFSQHKITWLRTKEGKKHEVDYKLEELEQILDPTQFFRLNRKYFASFDSISSVTAFSNSRLKVLLHRPEVQEDVLISREKATAFKDWMDQ